MLNELDQYISYDFDSDYARKCIEANKHNHITATYNLMLKKQMK